jgi:ethanolamine ammonia-lyase small subunit
LDGFTQLGWQVAPVVLGRLGRVALGDHIGAALGATLAMVVIGERPGLSASDSLGIYLTYGPRPGRTDAQRNCISNVRPDGLAIDIAARLAIQQTQGARQQGYTGIFPP